ncbi:MAG: hypothetical protein N2560_08685, partial [Ignavibacteria bacterium]|nr:hypothetical protein [Ignavibacteria bacterium]
PMAHTLYLSVLQLILFYLMLIHKVFHLLFRYIRLNTIYDCIPLSNVDEKYIRKVFLYQMVGRLFSHRK